MRARAAIASHPRQRARKRGGISSSPARIVALNDARLLSEREARPGIFPGHGSKRSTRHDQTVAGRNQPLDALVSRVPLLDSKEDVTIWHDQIEHAGARNKRCFSVSKTCRNSCKFLHRSALLEKALPHQQIKKSAK